jgi:hypothetical protein
MIIPTFIIFLTSIPTAYLLHKLTNDEAQYINYYFTLFTWPLAIAAAILYSINLQASLTVTYLLITTLIWKNLNKTSKNKK